MKSFRRMCLVGLLAAALPVSAQRQAKVSVPREYATWVNEEVVYIISDEERKEFLKLKSNADRDKFIEEFWEIRNPLRGSKENAFKEEHYRRVEYANQNFGRESNTPGWKTDMGRTYILFGKPQSRAPFKGYGQIYPLELWFYQNSTGGPSLPPFFYVLFFMPEDIGEYRFYRPIVDGPLKLVRGSQFRTNRDVYQFLKPLGGDLARAVLSPIPSDPIDTQEFSPGIAGEMLVSKIQNFANDSFQLQRLQEARYLREKVKSWFLVIQDKPLELASIVLADPAGAYWLDYGVLIDEEKLGRPHPEGKQLIVNSSFRLLSEKGDLIVEDAEERAFPAFDDSTGEKKFKPFVLANRIPIAPGKYKLETRLDNREANRSYKAEKIVEVAERSKAWLAGPLLASSVSQARKPDPATPFQYFGVQFLPAVERQLSRSHPLRILFQVHVPTEKAGNYQVQYLLAHMQDRSLRRTLTDNIAGGEFQNGRLLKSKTIPMTEFEAGDYRLVLTLHPEASAEVVASVTVAFKLSEEKPLPALDFVANSRGAANAAVASYIRALESLSQNDEDRAAEYLRQSLDQNSPNSLAIRSLVRIYFSAGKFDRVAELYNRFGLPIFSGAPETLAQAALSLWKTGNRESAKRVLEAARSAFPQDALLVATAKRIEQPISPPTR